MAQTIVIASGKGGTGKTTLTAGLGTALAERGLRCLCIDADVGVRSLDLTLGMFDTALFDFSDVAEGRAALRDAVALHPLFPKLLLLTAPLTPRDIAPDALRRVAQEAAREELADFILIDAPAGLGEDFLRAARGADRAVVVATPDLVSLRSADRTAAALEALGFSDFRLVVNRVRPRVIEKNNTPNIDDAMDMSGLPLLGYIPEEEAVLVCGALGRPVLTRRRSLAARALRNIAARLDGEEIPVLRL